MWCNLVLYNWLERPRPNRREQGVQERREKTDGAGTIITWHEESDLDLSETLLSVGQEFDGEMGFLYIQQYCTYFYKYK